MQKINRNNKVKNSNTALECHKNLSFISDDSNELPCYINDYFRESSAQSANLKTPDPKSQQTLTE